MWPTNAGSIQGAQTVSSSACLPSTKFPPTSSQPGPVLPPVSSVSGGPYLYHITDPQFFFTSWTSNFPGPILPSHSVIRTLLVGCFRVLLSSLLLGQAPSPHLCSTQLQIFFIRLTCSHQFNSTAAEPAEACSVRGLVLGSFTHSLLGS